MRGPHSLAQAKGDSFSLVPSREYGNIGFRVNREYGESFIQGLYRALIPLSFSPNVGPSYARAPSLMSSFGGLIQDLGYV